MVDTKATSSSTALTPGASLAVPPARALSSKMSQRQLVEYLSLLLDTLSFRAIWLELKLCSSPTIAEKNSLFPYSQILHVISTRKSPRRRWDVSSISKE